jgi:hypothetical protein
MWLWGRVGTMSGGLVYSTKVSALSVPALLRRRSYRCAIF